MIERRLCPIAVLAIALLLAATTAHAQTFVGPTGTPPDYSWHTAANWSTGAIPAAGGTTTIDNGQTAVLNAAGATRYLYVGSTTNGGGLTMNADLTLSSRIRVGEGGFFTSTVTQTAGTLLISAGQFYIGGQSKTDPKTDCPTGVYNLQGGTVTVGSSCNIAHRGIGQVYQSGGLFERTGDATASITIGSYDYGVSGLYDISGGEVRSAGSIRVGYAQNGTLRVSGTGLVNAATVTVGYGSTTAPTRGPYTSTVNQEGGTVQVGQLVRNDIFSDSSTSIYNLSGGVLRLTSSAASTVGALHLLGGTSGLGGTIEAAPDMVPTLTSNVDYDAQAGTVKVALGGEGIKLNKTTEGLLTLTAANTYTGDTTVSQGTLKLDGSVTSNVSVAAQAELVGGGAVTGDLDLAAGGTVAPGASVGTLTITGNATLAGTFDVEYDSSMDTIDMLSVSGQLDLSGGTLDFSDLAATPVALDQEAYVFASYGTLVGSQPAITAGTLPSGYVVDYAYGENDNQIALVAVPEPSTLLLVALGGLILAGCRRP